MKKPGARPGLSCGEARAQKLLTSSRPPGRGAVPGGGSTMLPSAERTCCLSRRFTVYARTGRPGSASKVPVIGRLAHARSRSSPERTNRSGSERWIGHLRDRPQDHGYPTL